MAHSSDPTTLWMRNSESDSDDVWDDSLLIEAYDKQKRLVEQALKNKKSNPDASDNVTQTDNTTVTKVKKDICEPPPFHCGSVIPRVPLFAVGDHCRCVYSADGQEYEADIVELFEDKKQCLVRYVGYDNEELRKLSEVKSSLGEDVRVKQVEQSKIWFNGQEDNSNLQQMPSSPEPDIDPATSRKDVKKVINSITAQHKDTRNVKEVQRNDRKKHRVVQEKLVNESIILPYRKLLKEESSGAPSTENPSSSNNSNQYVPPGNSVPLCPPPLPPCLLSGRTEEDDALASMLMSWYMSGYHTGYYEAMKKYKK